MILSTTRATSLLDLEEWHYAVLLLKQSREMSRRREGRRRRLWLWLLGMWLWLWLWLAMVSKTVPTCPAGCAQSVSTRGAAGACATTIESLQRPGSWSDRFAVSHLRRLAVQTTFGILLLATCRPSVLLAQLRHCGATVCGRVFPKCACECSGWVCSERFA